MEAFHGKPPGGGAGDLIAWWTMTRQASRSPLRNSVQGAGIGSTPAGAALKRISCAFVSAPRCSALLLA